LDDVAGNICQDDISFLETRFESALDDVAGDICQALNLGRG